MSALGLGVRRPRVFLLGPLGASDLHHEKEEHAPSNHRSEEDGKRGADLDPTFAQSLDSGLTSQTVADPQTQG